MGLGNSSSGNRVFLNIKEGKIALRKDNNIELFDHITGVITGVDTHEGKFGKELHITLTDDAASYLLQMRFDGGYARGFMMAVKNADLRQPVTLTPKYEEKDGKKKSSLFISQFGKALKWFWNKDNQGDLPPMTSREWKGKTEWDNTAQLDYLERMLMQEIKPLLTHPAVVVPVEPERVQVQSSNSDVNDPDDLPF